MISYVLESLLLGLGIAVDVALATVALARFMGDRRNKYVWTSAVTFTHVLFPMIGYYGFAWAYRMYPGLEIWLGLSGVAIISMYLSKVFYDILQPIPNFDDLNEISVGAVFAVSLDALWSGPAKSAQAVDWTEFEIAFSFIIGGLVVAIVAIISAFYAANIYKELLKESGVNTQIRRQIIALWLEFTVLGYFGCLAFVRYVLGLEVGWGFILLCTSLSIGILFYIFHDNIEVNRRAVVKHITEHDEL